MGRTSLPAGRILSRGPSKARVGRAIEGVAEAGTSVAFRGVFVELVATPSMGSGAERKHKTPSVCKI